MSTDSKHLVILAAGTGGHVMPGLAVAKVMASRGWKISWVGTVAGMERGLVERHGIPFHALDFQGVRGRGPLGAIKGGFKLIGAFFASMKLLNELKPDAVFSTGGYVAVPFGFAAHRRKLPLVMMNCDADLLMSTNTLLPFCDALACGFAGGARTFAKEKGRTTGNPVREEIVAVSPPQDRMANRTGPLRVFIFGGSLGAQVFNDNMPAVFAAIPQEQRPIIVHQTGKDRDAPVREAYEKLGVKAEVVPFINDMAARYEDCDVVRDERLRALRGGRGEHSRSVRRQDDGASDGQREVHGRASCRDHGAAARVYGRAHGRTHLGAHPRPSA